MRSERRSVRPKACILLAERISQRGRSGVRLASRHREGVTDNRLDHDTIRSGCEAISHAEVHIEITGLEVRYREQCVLLIADRREAADLAEIRIVFEANLHIRRNLLRCPERRSEIRFTQPAKSDVHDRIHDELVVAFSHADDRANFESPTSLGKFRRLVAQLEIDAVKELTLAGVGRHKEGSQLEAVGEELPILHGERQIKTELPPIRQAVGEFRRTIEAAGGAEATRKRRQGLTTRDIVEALLNGPLAHRRNRRVVDLNLICRMGGGAREAKHRRSTAQNVPDSKTESY